MSEEKRTFSRVPVRLKGHARHMRSIDSPQMFTGDIVGEEVGRPPLFQKSKLPEEVTGFLTNLDRKIDKILGLLSKDHLRVDFPVDVEIFEISAAGIKFRTDRNIAVNSPLEIIIILSQIPIKISSSKGRVVGIEDETGLYRFEFVDTRGSDMEAIVQFVFQQQRELIRNSKK